MMGFGIRTFLTLLSLTCLVAMTNSQDGPEPPVRGEDRLPDSGLKPVYTMFKWFLEDVVQPEELDTLVENLPDVDFTDGEEVWESIQEDWEEWVLYWIGFAVCLGIGVILLLLISPLGGCVACCRCCGNCGGKIKSHDGKNANCARACCGTSLFIIASIMLLGVIVMFVTSERVRDKLKGDNNIFVDMASSFRGLDDYKNSSLNDMESTTMNAFYQTKDEVFFVLDNLVVDTFVTLDNCTQATSVLNRMATFTDELANLSIMLDTTQETVERVSDSVTELETKLNDSASAITALLTDANCTSEECEGILADVNHLTVTEDYGVISVDYAARAVDKAVNELEVPQKIHDGIDAVKDIATEINETFLEYLNDAKTETEKVEDEIKAFLDDFREELMAFDFSQLISTMEEVEEDASEPADWVYWSMVGIAALLTAITACFFFGLLCGVTCPRPSENQYCGTRKVGADWLLAGIGLAFIFYWLLMVVLIVMFFGLGATHTEACRHLVHFNESPVVDLLDDLIGNTVQDEFGVNISVKNIYTNCGENKAAYTAFDLENNGLNISEVLDTKYIDQIVNEIKDIEIEDIDVEMLPEDIANSLRTIGNATNFPYDVWYSVLDKNSTDADLMGLADKLEGLTDPDIDNETLASLVDDLRTISQYDLPAIANTTEQLRSELMNVETTLGPVDLVQWTDDIDAAQYMLHSEGSSIIKDEVDEKADSVGNTFHQMVEKVDHEVREDVAQCFPVFESFTLLVDTNCVDLLYQASAYWFALGWCMIFLLPAIIISFKLVSLFRKTLTYEEGKYGAPYQAYYDEPEQMQMGNQETILLSKLPPGARSYTQGMTAADNPMYFDDEGVLRIPRPHVRQQAEENPPPYEKHSSHYV